MQPRNGSVNITPSTVHKTGVGQGSGLPSWLTDQPTHLDLPVLRGNTGQLPAVPQERSPVLPKTPPTSMPTSSLPSFLGTQVPLVPQERSPVLPETPQANGIPASLLPSFASASSGQLPDVSAEWPALPRLAGLNPADSGLRKINPEESMFTTPHRAIKANGSAPTEWQAPPSGSLNGASGPSGPLRAPGFPERKGDTLQSLAALKQGGLPAPTASAPLVPPVAFVPSPPPQMSPVARMPSASSSDPRGGLNGVGSLPSGQLGREMGEVARSGVGMGTASGKRNYPALAAALQTIGYSVAGFVASAVVGLDGAPIAQVAVDEMDISPLCAYLCTIVQGASRVIEPERGGDCEHIRDYQQYATYPVACPEQEKRCLSGAHHHARNDPRREPGCVGDTSNPR